MISWVVDFDGELMGDVDDHGRPQRGGQNGHFPPWILEV